MDDVLTTVLDIVRSLLQRRSDEPAEVAAAADLFDDIDLDSLEVAELSALLEERYGTDPYSAGLVPRTAAEVAAFYDGR